MSARDAERRRLPPQNRFEAVFQHIPHPTAISRVSDGTCVYVNDRLVQVSGFSREEIIGQSPVTLGMWTLEERMRYVAPLVAAGGGNMVVTLRKKDGTPVRAALSCRQIDFDGEPCMVTVGMDVTEQEATEVALRDADRRKDAAMAVLAHELRNPLVPILVEAEILMERADRESRDSLDIILRQAKHLARLVDDLLDVSSLANAKITLSKTRLELATVVARAVEATGPLFSTRGHRLEVSVAADGLAIEADEIRLTQVVINLLSNAARYTPRGGNVVVAAARDGDDVILRVQDSGIGIDATLMPEIFKMFVQGGRVPVGEREHAGLGLGLPLVQMLTEMHGGSVAARSAGPAHGSEFTVRLPAAPSAKEVFVEEV